MSDRTKKLVRFALFIALACALTIFPKIPIGGGYVHLGDCVIYAAAALMGPVAGAVTGAVGHSLADLISGFPIYCLPTLIIKAIVGFTAGKLLYNRAGVKYFALNAAASFVVITGGYFIAEIPLLGYKTALISLISSPIQWAASTLVTAALLPVILRYKDKMGF